MVNRNPWRGGNWAPYPRNRVGNFCFACGGSMPLAPNGHRLEWRQDKDGKILFYAHIACEPGLTGGNDMEGAR